MIGALPEANQLGVPLDADGKITEPVAHNVLVVVLAEHQREWKWAQVLADISDRDARSPAPARPHVGGRAAGAEGERLVDDAQLCVDFERARLHRHGTRLLRRSRMPVDDAYFHTASSELIGEHQTGRARTHNQNVHVHSDLQLYFGVADIMPEPSSGAASPAASRSGSPIHAPP